MVVLKERINERKKVIHFCWSCVNERHKLMRNLIFGQMVVLNERINERKKVIHFCRMVVCK